MIVYKMTHLTENVFSQYEKNTCMVVEILTYGNRMLFLEFNLFQYMQNHIMRFKGFKTY